MRQEFADGQDAVKWIVKQPWSNGVVGTWGSSYDGFTALAAAVDTPEVKLVLADGAPERAFETWPATRNGIVTADLIWWDRDTSGAGAEQDDPRYQRIVTNSRPVRDLDIAAFGATDPVWRSTLPFMEKHSDYWEGWNLTNKLSRICAPVVSMEARDEYTTDCLDTYLALAEHPCSKEVGAAHRFILHDGRHGGAIYRPLASTRTGEIIRSYMARYLKGEAASVDASPVHYFVQKANEWHTADRWPATTKSRVFYLDAQEKRDVDVPKGHPAHFGWLTAVEPAADATIAYTFDPARDDACDPKVISERAVFESAKLGAQLALVGRAELVLFVKVDVPDTDIQALLIDDKNEAIGQPAPLRLRFRHGAAAPEPMSPGEVAEIHIRLNATAYRFEAGKTFGVLVRSTTCGWSENPNTGGPMTDETNTRPAHIEILTGPAHPSRLIVPEL
jgi:hypothetical protein